jgi:hypothetical protein
VGFDFVCGERGIRTPGPVTVNGFQDRRIRPLCHLSGAKIQGNFEPSKYLSIIFSFSLLILIIIIPTKLFYTFAIS